MAGAIVAVAFASGLVEHQYENIARETNGDFPKFVEGVVKLLAVSILGGYLGVRLIDQVAERLLAQQIDNVKGELNSVQIKVDVERTLRESARSLQQGFPGEALRLLDDLLKELPSGNIRPDDMANLRVLRGYALKRLGRLDDAQREVEESIRIKPTYAGWYNKACYAAINNANDAARDEILQALIEASRLARLQGGMKALSQILAEDISSDGDLHAFKEEDTIQEIIANENVGRNPPRGD